MISLTSSEWNTIKDFCLLLEPFDVATIEMSAENNISISKVVVIVRGIQYSLNANSLTAKGTRIHSRTASGYI